MPELFGHRQIIYTIYKEQSFSKAAQKLFMAQPSLSLLVKKLENQLGVPLFDRSCKPIRLTEAGKEYIRAVETIRQTEADFMNYLQSARALEAGTLGIGSNQLLSSLVLPKYIAEFNSKYPNIQLTLMDANSTTLQNALNAGELDMVIDNHILPPDLFEQAQIEAEHLLLAVPSAFPENEALRSYQLRYADVLAGRHIGINDAFPLEKLQKIPFILMNRDNDTRKVTDRIFQETGFCPTVLFELDRLTTLYSYIELGAAASIVSDTLVRNMPLSDPERISFYPLSSKNAARGIYISYKKNKYHSPAMQAFAESLSNLK
ncbi:MAG: LysR family transcriptional regulator [Ruminococcaceae bacterium]|nr:LysR family transcriptional regulator [Oscillospiraceae bacterium]